MRGAVALVAVIVAETLSGCQSVVATQDQSEAIYSKDPDPLRRELGCMYEIAKSTSGVRKANLQLVGHAQLYVVANHRWAFAEEVTTPEGKTFLSVSLPGMLPPDEPIVSPVAKVLLAKWQSQCHVNPFTTIG